MQSRRMRPEADWLHLKAPQILQRDLVRSGNDTLLLDKLLLGS
jgi:hypothetical protein